MSAFRIVMLWQVFGWYVKIPTAMGLIRTPSLLAPSFSR